MCSCNDVFVPIIDPEPKRYIRSASAPTFSVRLDPAILASLRAAAPTLGMSINHAVNEACDAWLASDTVRTRLRSGLDADEERLAVIRRLSGESP